MTRELEVDPTGLLPGDVVLSLSEHDMGGCHCDVRVRVRRETGSAADCTCHFDCTYSKEHCSLAGEWHVHAGDPCPVHPDAPREW